MPTVIGWLSEKPKALLLRVLLILTQAEPPPQGPVIYSLIRREQSNNRHQHVSLELLDGSLTKRLDLGSRRFDAAVGRVRNEEFTGLPQYVTFQNSLGLNSLGEIRSRQLTGAAFEFRQGDTCPTA